jgi:GNAT superfamily N-acetyltransferase
MEQDRGRASLSAAAHGIGAGRMTASQRPPQDLPRILAVGEAEIGACFQLMRQLRPHLTSVEEFVERWRRQSAEGYSILALWPDRAPDSGPEPKPSALAGYRITENLIHGKFLYVDDLVSDQTERGRGHGALLLDRLKEEGRARGCKKLVLDTGLDNALAHRFYYRQGLLASALRFNVLL